MRDDLPPGVAAAQIAHAAGFSAQLRYWRTGEFPRLPQDTHVVILSASAAQLDELTRSTAPDDFVPVVEVDAPYIGQLLAIGLRPAERRFINRDFLRKLPLYGGGPR